jgi:hypothetical protein
MMRALSIRQPWAWLIVHGGKDIENRGWQTRYRGPLLVHAAMGMTKSQYDDARVFTEVVTGGSVKVPPPALLMRGGIIGRVEVVDCVAASESAWFMGEFGLVLSNPEPLPFQPYKGSLGLFKVPT